MKKVVGVILGIVLPATMGFAQSSGSFNPENNVKFVPWPSQVAPRGWGEPSRSFIPGRCS